MGKETIKTKGCEILLLASADVAELQTTETCSSLDLTEVIKNNNGNNKYNNASDMLQCTGGYWCIWNNLYSSRSPLTDFRDQSLISNIGSPLCFYNQRSTHFGNSNSRNTKPFCNGQISSVFIRLLNEFHSSRYKVPRYYTCSVTAWPSYLLLVPRIHFH